MSLVVAGCGVNITHGSTSNDGGAGGGGTAGGGGGGGGTAGGGGGGGGGNNGVYTIYTHSNTTLYTIDLSTKSIVTIGDFNAPNSDVIQDLAVAPDDTIWVISKTTLYTADPKDGHVTTFGSVTDCGMDNVALTTTPDGKLFAADYGGAFCQIDISGAQPVVTPIGMLGSNMAVAGDIVGVGDGTIYGTAYNLSDSASTGTSINNILVKIDPKTGIMQTMLGATGYPKLFGVAYDDGKVFGFTHDGSGDVITIDPATGKGTLFNTFTDPKTGKGIPFSGAGVNSKVPPIG